MKDKYYEHKPSTVSENNKDTVLLEMPIQTDKEIRAQDMI